jgi:hypothetical protein
MNTRKTQIDELRIRASGLTREQGRQLGRMVAEQLSEVPLSTSGSQNISEVSLRIRSQGRNSLETLATRIADSIRRKV